MPTRRPSAPKTFNSNYHYKLNRRPAPASVDEGRVASAQKPHRANGEAISTNVHPGKQGAKRVRDMFDAIAPAYDRFNAWASFGLDQAWRRRLAAMIPAHARVLDIATGTGDTAFVVMAGGHDVTGLDFSEAMLSEARRKDRSGKIRWVNASADRLPFSDRSFGCVTSAFALRNLRGHLEQVLKENFRVLKVGGKVLHMDFGMPAGLAGWGHRLHLRYGVPFIGQKICREHWPQGYLENTIREFYTPEEMLTLLAATGFRNVRQIPLLWGTVRIYEGIKA